MSTYAADGSVNITVVNGLSVTGLYAADGSFNVVPTTGGGTHGAYHPCGALWVTVAPDNTKVSLRAPDGSMYISQNPYTSTGAQRVTLVSGSFSSAAISTYYFLGF